ncbi:seven transmembrane domain protein [Zea mays]|uniref:BOS complex subunit TMEM147 n=1 Tax=Zea mays TaxID=4577 RepID=A0A1D6NSE8_MAIZE|nr:seven transmembrane domain protein [Zea mays]
MKVFIEFTDVAGLYFALTQLTHRNISQNHKFQAVGHDICLGFYSVPILSCTALSFPWHGFGMNIWKHT